VTAPAFAFLAAALSGLLVLAALALKRLSAVATNITANKTENIFFIMNPFKIIYDKNYRSILHSEAFSPIYVSMLGAPEQ
jgi:hypothetical protein